MEMHPYALRFHLRPEKFCEICAQPFKSECRDVGELGRRRFCRACAQDRVKCRQRKGVANQNETARRITKYAVKLGFLLHPSNYICMDCKRCQAECYDHRDYSKPLEVEAVCLRCNSSRGRGIPLHLVKPESTTNAA